MIQNHVIVTFEYCHVHYQLLHAVTLSCWQQSWDLQTGNKLHAIVPKVGPMESYGLPRRDEIKIRRLRIGHTRLTHSYLMKGENPPQCTCCQTVLTIEHLLLHCNNYTSIRNKYYDTTTLSELFSKISPHKILEFLKECNLYHKIKNIYCIFTFRNKCIFIYL